MTLLALLFSLKVVESHNGPTVWGLIVFISNGRLLWEAILEKLLITIGNLKYFRFQFLGRDKCTAPQVGLKKKKSGSLAEFSRAAKQFCLRIRLLNSLSRIPRGPVQQPLEDRIFPPTVSAVYSTVSMPSVCHVVCVHTLVLGISGSVGLT